MAPRFSDSPQINRAHFSNVRPKADRGVLVGFGRFPDEHNSMWHPRSRGLVPDRRSLCNRMWSARGPLEEGSSRGGLFANHLLTAPMMIPSVLEVRHRLPQTCGRTQERQGKLTRAPELYVPTFARRPFGSTVGRARASGGHVRRDRQKRGRSRPRRREARARMRAIRARNQG